MILLQKKNNTYYFVLDVVNWDYLALKVNSQTREVYSGKHLVNQGDLIRGISMMRCIVYSWIHLETTFYWEDLEMNTVTSQVFSKRIKIPPQIHIRKFEEQIAC